MFHYVYRITNLRNLKHYYGVRTSNVLPKFDLGIHYFSSSTDKIFIEEQHNSSCDFKYKIIMTFESREEANAFEIKLHSRFNVSQNPMFYNRANHTSSGFCVYGYKFEGEAYKNIVNGNKLKNLGKKHSEEVKIKMSIAKKGKPAHNKNIAMSDVTREKMANAKKGRTLTEDTKTKMSKAKLCRSCGFSNTVLCFNKETCLFERISKEVYRNQCGTKIFIVPSSKEFKNNYKNKE